MNIETSKALLAEVKDARELLSKDADSAAGLLNEADEPAKVVLSKATENAAALLRKAAEEAKVVLSKATGDIEGNEAAKVLLNEAAETAEALLNEAAGNAAALLIKADYEAKTLLIKAAETAEKLLARVKRLEGIIPICSYCKKIRDDQNNWQQLEQYLSEHTDALFSHGICQHCMEEQMSELSRLT